jgi:hypothetical protein
MSAACHVGIAVGVGRINRGHVDGGGDDGPGVSAVALGDVVKVVLDLQLLEPES